MTFEKGTSEVYGKQVYDHYLAIDETVNVTVARQGPAARRLDRSSGRRRVDQGADCTLQPNKLVSPLHRDDLRAAADRAAGLRLLLPAGQPRGRHGGAAAATCSARACTCTGSTSAATIARRARVRPGRGVADARCPPARSTSRWTSRQKHWIQAVLGEDPYQPLNLLLRRRAVVVLAAARPERQRLPRRTRPRGVTMTEIGDPAFGSAPARRQRGLRVRHRLDAGARAWSPSCSTRARPSTRGADGVRRGGQALRDRRGAGRRRVARRLRYLQALAVKRSDAGVRR